MLLPHPQRTHENTHPSAEKMSRQPTAESFRSRQIRDHDLQLIDHDSRRITKTRKNEIPKRITFGLSFFVDFVILFFLFLIFSGGFTVFRRLLLMFALGLLSQISLDEFVDVPVENILHLRGFHPRPHSLDGRVALKDSIATLMPPSHSP